MTGRFGMTGFMKAETVPPDVQEYLVVPLAAKVPKDWRPIALETIVEAQELEHSQTMNRREVSWLASDWS